MNFRNITIAIALCLGFQAGAQTVDLTVGVPSQDLRIFVRPVNEYTKQAITELASDSAGHAKGQVTVNPDGLYYLYASNPQMQYALPFYIPSDKQSADFNLTVDGFIPSTSMTDNSNAALGAYAAIQGTNSRLLGREASQLSNDRIKDIILSYTSAADSIIRLRELPAPVAEFMRLQAYIAASDAFRMVDYMASRSQRFLGFRSADVLPEASSVLDTPMSVSFPSAAQIIMATLPQGSLEERLAAIDSKYKSPEVKSKVREMLVSSFIDTFDYANDFDNGEARLKAVVEQYSLPDNYLAAFRGHRATIAGTPFPASVKLVDREGNEVDFSKFRGKFVYVDLWASWCGPCCREVPYLQQLEKEFENSDVVFVSISIDSTKAPWLKKMDQLKMHGNQLWNSDGELPKLLNIRGIPHFLIYDRDGKLLNYDAPRPSSEEIKGLLRSLK